MKHHNFRSLLLSAVFCFFSVANMAQVPEMFNYQAVARDVDRNPIVSTDLNVKVAIIFSSPTGLVLWEEQHSVLTSEEGIFSLMVGDPSATKTSGTMSAFSDIDWQAGSMFIRPSIEYLSAWHEMDASPMVSVPYALVAQKAEIGQFPINGDVVYLPDGSLAIGSDDAGGSKLAVISGDDDAEDALFEVKRADGQTVFAVYPDAVRIYVAKGDPLAKARTRGGFAIAGFDTDKATPINDLLWLTPDSVRFYIDDTPQGKARTRGGFAIAGFDTDKALGNNYMSVSGSAVPDVIQASSQILFYPLKDAFMAGYIEVEDPAMVGQNSASIGYKNIASGRYSQAFGYLSQATGDYSMAVGKSAISSGESSFSFGEGASATNLKSYAMGFESNASGVQSYAIGKQSYASGNEAMAIGFNSNAAAMSSMALGSLAEAQKQNSTAIGYDADANGDNSLSIGYQASAAGNGSSAIGFQSIASGIQSTALTGGKSYGHYSFSVGLASRTDGSYSTAIGSFNDANSFKSIVVGSYGTAPGNTTTWVETDPIFVVGNGQSSYSTAMSILKNGEIYLPFIHDVAITQMSRLPLYIDHTGKIGILSSSERYKENISDMDDVNWLMKLRPRSFEYIDDQNNSINYGLIAEEVENANQLLVSYNDNGTPETVFYDKLVVPMLKMTQQQEINLKKKNIRIIELENENAEIKARLDALEAVVNTMLGKQ